MKNMAIVRGRIFYSNEMARAFLVIRTSTDITATYEDTKKIGIMVLRKYYLLTYLLTPWSRVLEKLTVYS
jgi:hypothetical protein